MSKINALVQNKDAGLQCPCGVFVKSIPCRIKMGRGKYCSKICMYKYRVRPSGLHYRIAQVNKGWIVAGGRLSINTEFKPGQVPHNWLGDGVGYAALHDWVKRHRGRAEVCEFCNGTERVQWANRSFQYKRVLDDWLSLCYRCHRRYDMSGDWGAATRKYGLKRKRRVHEN